VEDWEKMIDVNIKGVLYAIAAALPVFRKHSHFAKVRRPEIRLSLDSLV
jgi:NADP-dependent 3-hydroxy acid dehydrogenase YdfG